MGVLLCSLVLAPVVLKRTPKVDDRREYSMRALIDLGGKEDVRFTGNFSERVKAVDGSTVTYDVNASVSTDVLGVVRQGAVLNSTRVERLDGALITPMRVERTLLFGVPRVDQMRAFFFPTAPVEIGSSWWRTEGKNDGFKAPPFSSYIKLEGEEKVGKWDAWKVSVDAREVDTDSPTRVKGMIWLDKADGALLQGQWAIDGYVASATTPPLSARYELTRVDREERPRTPLNLAFSSR